MAQLTDKCRIVTADETLEDPDVIDTIQQLDRGICRKLPNTVVSEISKQLIMKSTTDSEALGHLKKVCLQ